MGIHRINQFFVEEFESPGDLRFRIETDIRIPQTKRDDKEFLKQLRKAVESSKHEAVRDLLLVRLNPPAKKEKEVVSEDDLIRVRRLVIGALSRPQRPLPQEPAYGGAKSS